MRSTTQMDVNLLTTSMQHNSNSGNSALISNQIKALNNKYKVNQSVDSNVDADDDVDAAIDNDNDDKTDSNKNNNSNNAQTDNNNNNKNNNNNNNNDNKTTNSDKKSNNNDTSSNTNSKTTNVNVSSATSKPVNNNQNNNNQNNNYKTNQTPFNVQLKPVQNVVQQHVEPTKEPEQSNEIVFKQVDTSKLTREELIDYCDEMESKLIEEQTLNQALKKAQQVIIDHLMETNEALLKWFQFKKIL